MVNRDNYWALVLAAGDGRRLQGLTRTASGDVIPKQFCSLNGGLSFLEETVQRAQTVVPRDRVCAIVACAHRRHWLRPLASLPAQNVIAQPRNRGTAIGILLPLLHILERDPKARILLLPSDHHIRDEARLTAAQQAAMAAGRYENADIVLLGIEPDHADPELGYIVPLRTGHPKFRAVGRFVEKPSAEEAGQLIRQGALWNTFIIAADAAALLRLFEWRCPEIVAKMRRSIRRGCGFPAALARLYDEMAELDFSRGILQGQERQLRVLAVPECGWSDLGTPERVAAALHGLDVAASVSTPIRESWSAVNLAAQHALCAQMGRSAVARAG